MELPTVLHVDMETKTVALDPEAYAILRKARHEGESFSDAVKKLAGKRASILDLAGAWSDVPAGAWEEMRRRRREAEVGRRERIGKRWG